MQHVRKEDGGAVHGKNRYNKPTSDTVCNLKPSRELVLKFQKI